MKDRTTVAGIAICIAVLLVWTPLMRRLGWMTPARPKTPAAAAQPAAPADPAETPPPEGADTEALQVPAPAPAPVPPQSVPDAPLSATSFPPPAETAELAVPGVLTANVAVDGGGITRVRLHRYLEDDLDGAVTLGRYQQPFCALLRGGRPWELGPPVLRARQDDLLVVERTAADGRVRVVETWRTPPDHEYRVTYSVRLVNLSAEPLDVRDLAVSCGAVEAGAVKRGIKGRAIAAAGAVDVRFSEAARPRSFTVKNITKLKPAARTQLAAAPLAWIALHSKYFVLFLAGDGAALTGCDLALVPATEADNKSDSGWLTAALHLPAVTLAPGTPAEWTFTGYAGPKEYQRLHAVAPGLESVMQMDLFLFWHPRWMEFITRIILRSLIGLNDFFQHKWGYGFAIMIITFVIKMLFWPLTHKSTVSMRKMQQIQPLVQDVRTKYKDQPEKMNRKVMELYREHKVNPVGGCLPMLLQIPVFFALFNTFRSAIELRHAAFLWVADLSQPDTVADPFGIPLRPLAILMAVSMFGQQKMMPSSADPAQARMMTFMMIFFAFIFYGMPAGLTLYWTVNQILTIVQNLVSRKLEKEAPARAATT